MLLKRQAFAVFSGEIDQYHLYLPLIQGEINVLYTIRVLWKMCPLFYAMLKIVKKGLKDKTTFIVIPLHNFVWHLLEYYVHYV